LYQSPTDSQSQSNAFAPTVQLDKTAEYGIDLISRYSLSAILHEKLDRSRRSLISKTDEPLLGMLDRIREQIRKDLCQAVLISLHHQGLAVVQSQLYARRHTQQDHAINLFHQQTNIQLLINQR